MVETYDDTDYIDQLEAELRQEQSKTRQLAKSQMGMYETENSESNLIKWQLNLEEEKDRLYHLLKGHRKIIDEKGNEVWVPPESKDSEILNEYGVDYIMGLLESFLNRNIILSNFDYERINKICLDLGMQITFDIYNDYEKMGMDTDDKRKKAAILVWKVLINVEAALRRAMFGRENLNLRKIITVSQHESPMLNQQQMNGIPVVSQQPKRGFFRRMFGG